MKVVDADIVSPVSVPVNIKVYVAAFAVLAVYTANEGVAEVKVNTVESYAAPSLLAKV
jgi:hypothetical protein